MAFNMLKGLLQLSLHHLQRGRKSVTRGKRKPRFLFSHSNIPPEKWNNS
jgi:hypothetical protein